MKRMLTLIICIPLLSMLGCLLIWVSATNSPDTEVVTSEAMSKTSWQQQTESQP